jgi:hypothetical protein
MLTRVLLLFRAEQLQGVTVAPLQWLWAVAIVALEELQASGQEVL